MIVWSNRVLLVSVTLDLCLALMDLLHLSMGHSSRWDEKEGDIWLVDVFRIVTSRSSRPWFGSSCLVPGMPRREIVGIRDISPKLNSRKMLFAHSSILSYLIVSKLCAAAVVCAESLNRLATKLDFLGEWAFVRFQFKMRFVGPYIATATRFLLSVLSGRAVCRRVTRVFWNGMDLMPDT